MRAFSRTCLAFFSAIILLSCSGGTDPNPNPRVIELAVGEFMPSTVTVKTGTTVRWVNRHAMVHTITPEDPTQPGVWQEVELSGPGEFHEHTFRQAGQIYRYRCLPHSAGFNIGMTGTIRVE